MGRVDTVSISVLICNEYVVECDKCGVQEVYHTGDIDHGIWVHTERTARQASGYHYLKGQLLCPICFALAR